MKDAGRDRDVVGQLDPLRRYALSLTRDRSEAEDLVQETLVKALERGEQLRSAPSLRAWLMSILHNRFVDGVRARRAETARYADYGLRIDPAVPAPQEGAARLADLRRAFMSLPADQRAALHLICVEGLSYEKAAALLSVPVGTLVSRLARGRARLRAMEDGEPENVVPLRPKGEVDARRS